MASSSELRNLMSIKCSLKVHLSTCTQYPSRTVSQKPRPIDGPWKLFPPTLNDVGDDDDDISADVNNMEKSAKAQFHPQRLGANPQDWQSSKRRRRRRPNLAIVNRREGADVPSYLAYVGTIQIWCPQHFELFDPSHPSPEINIMLRAEKSTNWIINADVICEWSLSVRTYMSTWKEEGEEELHVEELCIL